MMRQLANEPDGIGEPEAIALADVHFAGEGVERGKEAVFDEDIISREGLQETRLARVGVADERGARAVAPTLSLIGAVIGDVVEALLEEPDLAADGAAVGLELRFAGAAQPD